MSTHLDFVAEVEAFLRLSGLNATQFGKDALNDTRFVFMIRKGRSPSLKTVERVREFMAGYEKAAA